jgi:hypothetical protein
LSELSSSFANKLCMSRVGPYLTCLIQPGMSACT